jgi:hypothetical protein
MSDEIKYENTTLCTKCGGKCCKHNGCHFSPEDIKVEITLENLKALIDEGNISIECWDGDPRTDDCSGVSVYYLRMRTQIKFTKSPIVHASWGFETCVLWTEKGCPLKFEDRPKGARMLIPKENGCEGLYTNQHAAIDWIPYQEILIKLVEIYESMEDDENVN